MDYIVTRQEAALIERALVTMLIKMRLDAEFVEQDRKADHRQQQALIEKLLQRMHIANLYIPKEPPAAI